LLVVAAFALEAVHWRYRLVPETDSYAYVQMAKAFSQFSWPAWEDDAFRFFDHPYVTVGKNRVMAKYPPGLPLLMGLGYLVAGIDGALNVLPLAAILGAAAFWLLALRLFGAFPALVCSSIWLTAPCTLPYGIYPLTHSTDWSLTVLAVLLAMRCAEACRPTQALALGLLLGFLPCVRPTNILVWPAVGAAWWLAADGSKRDAFLRSLSCLRRACAAALRRQNLGSHLAESRSALGNAIAGGRRFLLAVAIPLALFAIYNWVSFGAPWRTGYALSGEQTAFSIINIPSQLSHALGERSALLEDRFWVLVLLGLIYCVRDRRMISFVCAWVVPTALLYCAYYYRAMGATYLRFFLIALPALMLAAGCLLERVSRRGLARAALLAASILWVWAVPPKTVCHLVAKHTLGQNVLNSFEFEKWRESSHFGRKDRTWAAPAGVMLSAWQNEFRTDLTWFLGCLREGHSEGTVIYSAYWPLWTAESIDSAVITYPLRAWDEMSAPAVPRELSRSAPRQQASRKKLLVELLLDSGLESPGDHLRQHVRAGLRSGLSVGIIAPPSTPELKWLADDPGISMRLLCETESRGKWPGFQVLRVDLAGRSGARRPETDPR